MFEGEGADTFAKKIPPLLMGDKQTYQALKDWE
jgi:hypothetical protein